MSKKGKIQCISLTIDAAGRVSGLGRIPKHGKMTEIELKDELAGTTTTFHTQVRNGKVHFFIRGANGYIRTPGIFALTSYTGRQFVRKLEPRRQKTFDEATTDFLKNICIDFSALQELIDRDMEVTPTKVVTYRKTKRKHGKKLKSGREIKETREVNMWNPVVDPENRYRILKGFMQSRKTWAIISTALYYLLKYRMSSFIVVQNSLDAADQLLGRIKDVFSSYVTHMEEEELKEQFDKLFKVLDCARGKTATDRELEKAMNGSDPHIYVVLRNAADIRPVNETVERLHTQRYVVLIDESDFNDSGTKAAVQVQLEQFKNRAGLVYDVTATPMTSLMKEDIDMGNVVVLSKPDGYKSILHVQCYDLKKHADYCASVDDNPFLKDKNLRGYIRDFAKTKPHKCRSFWGKQYHPRYSLVRIGSVIKPQLKAARWTHKNFGSKILVITYNGSGHGVTMRGDMLPNYSIFLDDSTESKFEKGVHTFSNGIHIGKIVAYLQANGGVMKFPRIMVFAGTLADRGITFGTADYGECVKNRVYPWHLTEMYYIAAKSTSQSNLLQAAGRLCGVYPDNIPLSLYTNSGDDVFRAFGVQEELIQRAKEGRVKAAFRKLAREMIPDLAISRDKCSKRRITAPKVRCPLKKVENDFIYGGMDWDVEGYSYDGTEAEFGSGKRKKKAKVMVTEEEREAMRADVEVRRVEEKARYKDETLRTGLEKVRKAYRNKRKNVYKIVTAFVNTEFEALTEDQLNAACGGKFQYDNYTRWDPVHSKYKLLDRLDGNEFILRGDVVEALHLLD